MATRSIIAVKTKDGYRSIYCHNDGYPSHHLPILKKGYDTVEKIQALMDLGDLSALGWEIGEKHDFDSRSSEGSSICTAYGRDRGETGIDACDHPTIGDLRYHAFENASYLYVFEDRKWRLEKSRS